MCSYLGEGNDYFLDRSARGFDPAHQLLSHGEVALGADRLDVIEQNRLTEARGFG
jgi:hypothetical protein